MNVEPFDAIVIGAGFYGCAIALHLRSKGFARVLVIERDADLLTRASYGNQARIHNGYHYPRNLVTAYRSRVNYRRFCRDYAFAVRSDFVKLYAVAAQRSKVTPSQFEHFMTEIGAPFERAPAEYRRLFDPRRIAAVYVTEESVFDATLLRAHFAHALAQAGVALSLRAEAGEIVPAGSTARVSIRGSPGIRSVTTRFLFNCSYARLNYNVRGPIKLTPLKHEITEIALIDAPATLRGFGVTVMDGPFFSCLPFPAEGCHSLSHVRYTPQGHFEDVDGSRDPVEELAASQPRSRVHFMIADAARYLPALGDARYRRSIFEIKTVLVRNEVDDGRPILLRREAMHPGAYSVLGGKIDNIYDILERVDDALGHCQAAPQNESVNR